MFLDKGFFKMTSKRLNSYNGRLDYKQIADGINCSKRNSVRLAEDARILLDAHRYASAASLAILAIEESGKSFILRSMAIADDDKEVLDLWKDFRSHTKKNVLWLMPQLFMDGARILDDYKSLFESESEHPYTLEKLKQISFYTDCLGKAHWTEPSLVIDKDLATALTQVAKMFAKATEVKEKEIELWVKHMGGVKESSLQEQKVALLNWYAEMSEFELLPKNFDFTDFTKWLGLGEEK